jgi:hypothetical protein
LAGLPLCDPIRPHEQSDFCGSSGRLVTRSQMGCLRAQLREKLPIAPMDELTARLESLLRLYAGACHQDQGDGTQLAQLFSKGLQLLIAEFGPRAVDAALDKIPDGSWQPGSLH